MRLPCFVGASNVAALAKKAYSPVEPIVERKAHKMVVRPQIQDSYGKATLADLERFEQEHGLTLPQEYRQFLQTNNGGRFPCQVAWRKELGVTMFNALNSEFDYDDLEVSLRTLRDWPDFPLNLVPISGDGVGNPICIALGDAELAPVWLVDHETSQCTQVTETLTEFLADIEYDEDWYDRDPTFLAVGQGDVDELARRLAAGAPLEARNDLGHTLLMRGVACGQARSVKLLLEAGADVHAQKLDGKTPLIIAANQNSVDVIKLLVNQGVNLDAVDEDGNTALIVAVCSQRERVAKLLIESGADVNARDGTGATALTYCNSSMNQEYLASILRRYGAIP